MEREALAKKVEQMNERNIEKAMVLEQKTPRLELQAVVSRLQSGGAATADPMTKDGECDSPKGDKKVIRSGVPSFNSKQLIESNNLAHKEYVMRAKELNDTAQRMNVDKRYKALAETAKALPDDPREARLKAVHQTYMATKTTPSKKKEELRPLSGGQGAQSSHKREAPAMLKCGLCMREFPAERLAGSALRRTIEKMRNQSSNLPNSNRDLCANAAEMIRNQSMSQPYKAPEILSAREPRQYESQSGLQGGHPRNPRCVSPEEWDREPESPPSPAKSARAAPTPKKKRGLYDYEVKLCVNCDIFVRITST